METKNQNSNPIAQNPVTNLPGSENGPVESARSLFFNVMPRVNPQGIVVQSKMEHENQVQPGVATEPSFVQKNKKYIIIGVVVIIFGALLTFFGIKFATNSYKPEDLLVKNPPGQIQTPKKSVEKTNSENFTTDQSWRDKYFPQCQDEKICGDDADPDRDGLLNLDENKLITDPNNADSDQDGLSDGDEAHIFLSDPLNNHTGNDPKYSDLDFIKGGYDIKTNTRMSPAQILALSETMKSTGLHPTTIVSLGDVLNTVYKFSVGTSTSPSTASSTLNSNEPDLTGFDTSFPAQQERDTRRSNTIKNIEAGLVKYQTDNKSFPKTSDFNQMYLLVKPYIKIATDSQDPINKPPYVYSYASNSDGSDFTLSFYSEVGKQLIKKTSADAQKDATDDEASVYDYQRQTDLDDLRSALLVYSQKNVAGNQDYVFPGKDKYKTVLVPEFISQIPKDPKTGLDYDYQVSSTFDAFTLKTTLQNPPPGNTGYICNQVDDCTFY